jgi:hypothetical protein
MAKRVRGSSSRPGQRARLQRGAPRPAQAAAAAPTVASRPTGLTPEEEARAAELEAGIIAEERAAEESLRRSRERGRRTADDVPVSARAGSIEARAAAEYGYVVRDVRRVAIIGGSLIAILIAVWAIVEATGIGPF